MDKRAALGVAGAVLGLCGGVAGFIAADRAQHDPQLLEAENTAKILTNQYINSNYQKKSGGVKSIANTQCERIYTAYNTFSEAIHGNNGYVMATCHADAAFEHSIAAITLIMNKPADNSRDWLVQKQEMTKQ